MVAVSGNKFLKINSGKFPENHRVGGTIIKSGVVKKQNEFLQSD